MTQKNKQALFALRLMGYEVRFVTKRESASLGFNYPGRRWLLRDHNRQLLIRRGSLIQAFRAISREIA